MDWQIPTSSVIFGPHPKAEAIRKSPDTFWLRLPTFTPNATEAAAYQSMLKLSNFSAVKNIIFYLRGNSGGDSRWAEAFIKATLSIDEIVDYDKARDQLSSVTIRYRASQNNVERLKFISQDPISGTISPTLAALAQHLEDALSSGKPIYTEQEFDDPITEIIPVLKSAHKYFVITDGYCVSSCLIMMDRLKLFQNLSHLGWPTDADTSYNQVNTFDFPIHPETPDIHLTLTYAMAHFDRLFRGDNIPYIPQQLYSGERWDQQGLESWAMGIVDP
ncbi:hypothetical protein WDW86_12070 [Bdellovibrionota bacterium FG-2]